MPENRHLSKAPEVEAWFARHTTKFHFFLRDFRDDSTLELGKSARFPICSCFKLAVLMELYGQLGDADQLRETMTVASSDLVHNGGVFSKLSPPFDLNLKQLGEAMMLFSDATATDLLIGRLGLKRVSARLSRVAPDSHFGQTLRSMLEEFRANYSIRSLKSHGLGEGDPKLSDFTNARDLASLLESAVRLEVPLQEEYRRVLSLPSAIRAWTASFFPKHFQGPGKSGSFGNAFFMNDCRALLDDRGEPMAIYALCTSGLRYARAEIEIRGGHLGLYILKHLGLPLQPNEDFSPVTWDTFEDVAWETWSK